MTGRTQLEKVRALTTGTGTWTLGMIANATGASEASASARLRDLRKEGYTVTCTRAGGSKQRFYTVKSPAAVVQAVDTAAGRCAPPGENCGTCADKRTPIGLGSCIGCAGTLHHPHWRPA